MAKKKKFPKILDSDDPLLTCETYPELWCKNPTGKVINFESNSYYLKTIDFSSFYGRNIDHFARAFHQLIESLAKEKIIRISTIRTYHDLGVRPFLEYVDVETQKLNISTTVVSDLNEKLIQNYFEYIRNSTKSIVLKRSTLKSFNALVVRMLSRKWVKDPKIPNDYLDDLKYEPKGQSPLSRNEFRRVVRAIKTDVKEVLEKQDILNSRDLSVLALAIAVRTGINPTPLVELKIDCIQPHYKDDRFLLISTKRRGKNSQIRALPSAENFATSEPVLGDVVAIVNHVLKRNKPLRNMTGKFNKDLFLYLKESNGRGCNRGDCSVLTTELLRTRIQKWVDKHALKDDDGLPLKLNIMRLRKTFINRIWELSDQDILVTARLGRHSTKVSASNYLEVPINAEKKFRLLGEVLTSSLLEGAPSAVKNSIESTPVSSCRSGQLSKFAPKEDGSTCTNFLACVRCKNFVVTQEDLYRLYSFYWLIVRERSRIGSKRWSKYFAHIIRIVDKDIGGQFDSRKIKLVKQKAKEKPHPFWMNHNLLNLDSL